MLRKLGSYPRQNGLAVALRELGRIERTLFILDWLQSVELRRRVHAGLNKGEARNSLARAVFFNRLGEIRDRSFEQQRYRASGLNLVTAAIVLWNTVYLERATQGWSRPASRWTASCCNSCRRWAGSTSTSPAITSGGRAADWKTGSFGPYGCPENLSVRFFRILRAPASAVAYPSLPFLDNTPDVGGGVLIRCLPADQCDGDGTFSWKAARSI